MDVSRFGDFSHLKDVDVQSPDRIFRRINIGGNVNGWFMGNLLS